MSSSVTVGSPRPNNCQLLVLRQLVDPEGGAVGPAVVETVLDDGQSITVAAEPNVVVVVMEHPRGKPVGQYALSIRPIAGTQAAPPPAPAPAPAPASAEPEEGEALSEVA